MVHQPPLSPKRERQLMDQVQRGDRGALGELLNAYSRQVYHVCLRMVSNSSDAADLTQDVLLKAIQHVDSFEGKSKFSTWLFRIAMNLSISHLRKRKVRRAVSLESSTNDDGHAGAPDQAFSLKAMIAEEREPGPHQSVETNEQIERVLAAVDCLDENLRSVILLRDLQDMDYQQMAEVLGVPVGTVKSRLFRARLALRQAVSDMTDSNAEPRQSAEA
jgi:RNA polymerase sigma-70 factor (ECF subfamily)